MKTKTTALRGLAGPIGVCAVWITTVVVLAIQPFSIYLDTPAPGTSTRQRFADTDRSQAEPRKSEEEPPEQLEAVFEGVAMTEPLPTP